MTISKNQPMRQAEIDLIDDYNENIGLIPVIQDDISELQTIVGDSSSGLVKDVDDLQTTVGDSSSGLVKDVDDLQTTVGDSSSGLVKDVDDLQTTVGDSSSGLVKDVDDLENDVFGLKNIIGDSTTGLVKDVTDIENDIGDIDNDITCLKSGVEGNISSTSGENTATFNFTGSLAYIMLKRASTTFCIALITYWDSGASFIGTSDNVSISHEANTREFTVTITQNTLAKGFIVSNNVTKVVS